MSSTLAYNIVPGDVVLLDLAPHMQRVGLTVAVTLHRVTDFIEFLMLYEDGFITTRLRPSWIVDHYASAS
jgi:hypothetical protein